jgi:benzil reductase ((S)-benzoin forming)
MKKIVMITGANRGLGKAIADLALRDENTFIISLSRTWNENEYSKKNYLFIKTDLSEPYSDKIIEKVRKIINSDSIIYFFNNGAVVSPIGKTGNLGQEAIGYSLRVNIEYPVNLIDSFLKNFSGNKMVLVNISSGAAKNATAHWAMYCSSKAYMMMFFEVLAKENRENPGVEVFHVDPGVMDTGMQEEIRSHVFPRQDYFRKLKADNGLAQPAEVAARIFEEIHFRS